MTRITTVICNKCGKKGEGLDANLFHSFNVGFGYGSEFDGETWAFDLCEYCLLEFIATFKIKPDKGELA